MRLPWAHKVCGQLGVLCVTRDVFWGDEGTELLQTRPRPGGPTMQARSATHRGAQAAQAPLSHSGTAGTARWHSLNSHKSQPVLLLTSEEQGHSAGLREKGTFLISAPSCPFLRLATWNRGGLWNMGQKLAGASPLPCFDLAPHGVWERFFQGWAGGGRALAGERQGEEREAVHTSRWCLTALGPSGSGQEGHHAQDSLSGCHLSLSPALGMDRACHTEEDCVTCCRSAKCTLCVCKYPRATITDPSLPPSPLTSTPARCEGGSQEPCMNPAHARVAGAPFTPHHPLKAEVIRPWT